MDGWVWGSWRYGWNAFSWRTGWHMQVTSEVGRIYKSSQHTQRHRDWHYDIQHFQLQVFVITTMLGSIGLGRVARLGMIEILNNADNAGASFLKLPLPPDRVWKNLDLCWSRCPLCLTRLQMCQMNEPWKRNVLQILNMELSLFRFEIIFWMSVSLLLCFSAFLLLWTFAFLYFLCFFCFSSLNTRP